MPVPAACAGECKYSFSSRFILSRKIVKQYHLSPALPDGRATAPVLIIGRRQGSYASRESSRDRRCSWHIARFDCAEGLPARQPLHREPRCGMSGTVDSQRYISAIADLLIRVAYDKRYTLPS